MSLPEAVALAIELGLVALLLGAAAQSARLWRFLPVLLALAVGEAFRQEVLALPWVAESLVYDVPWLPSALVVGVQLVALAAAPFLLGVPALRVPWLAVASPLLAGLVHPQLVRAVPGAGERAGLVLLAAGVSTLLPVLSPVAGLGGPVGDPLAAIGAAAIGAAALAVARRSRPSEATKPPEAPWRWRSVTPPVLVAGLVYAIGTWLAIACGVLEFAASGLEQAFVYIPRVTEAVIGLAGVLVGAVVGPMAGVLLYATEARALALDGGELQEALRVGIAVGGALPLLLTSRSSLRLGLPFWLLQVAWVVGCLLSS